MTIFVAGSSTSNPIQSEMPDWYSHYAGRQEPAAVLITDYNLFHNVEPAPGHCPPSEQADVDASWWGAHNRLGDPMFANPDKGDYRLLPESPARRAGRCLPNCPYDFDGRLRPLAHPDCGAFQATTPQ